MSKRRKPSDPEAARLARLRTKAEVERLEAQGAVVNVDKRDGRILSAYHASAFSSLLRAGTITTNHHVAAERLAKDWAIWKGLDGKRDGSAERVDMSNDPSPLVTDRMRAAGDRVALALMDVGRANRKLLEAMISDAVEQDRPQPWRRVVVQVTGETRDREQREKVVAALENLRLYYEAARRPAAYRASRAA